MGVNYADVIGRMKWAARLKNDSAVARALDVTPQALSNYKKRGDMPSGLVFAFSEKFGIGLDWLISGAGEVFKPGKAPAAGESPAPYPLGERAAHVNGSPEESEESVYITKLLKVLRSPDESHSRAMKSAIDAVLKAAEKG